MKVKLIRKKLKDKNWVLRRYSQVLQETNKMNTFKQFDCDPFFRGEELASSNLKLYDKKMFKLTRKINFLQKFL
jgi:uncharacterized Fe-S cluster-containing MiaB family protein